MPISSFYSSALHGIAKYLRDLILLEIHTVCRLYIYIYMCMCIYMCVCEHTHIFIHIHTYTHAIYLNLNSTCCMDDDKEGKKRLHSNQWWEEKWVRE